MDERDTTSNGLTYLDVVPGDIPVVVQVLSGSGVPPPSSTGLSIRSAGQGATWSVSVEYMGHSAAAGASTSQDTQVVRAAFPALVAREAGGEPAAPSAGSPALAADVLPRSGTMRQDASTPVSEDATLLVSVGSGGSVPDPGVYWFDMVVLDSATTAEMWRQPFFVSVRVPRGVVSPLQVAAVAAVRSHGNDDDGSASSVVSREVSLRSVGSGPLQWSVWQPPSAPCWMQVSAVAGDGSCAPPASVAVPTGWTCAVHGVAAAGSIARVSVEVDTALLDAGVYDTALLVVSDDPLMPTQRVGVQVVASPLRVCPAYVHLGDVSASAPASGGDLTLTNTGDGDVVVLGVLPSTADVPAVQASADSNCTGASSGTQAVLDMVAAVNDSLVVPAQGALRAGVAPQAAWLWPSVGVSQVASIAAAAAAAVSGLPPAVQSLAAAVQGVSGDRAAWWSGSQDAVYSSGLQATWHEAASDATPGVPVTLVQVGGELHLRATALYTPDTMPAADSSGVLHVIVWETARASLSVRSIAVSASRRVGAVHAATSPALQVVSSVVGEDMPVLLPGDGGVPVQVAGVAGRVTALPVHRVALTHGVLVGVAVLRDRYGTARPAGGDVVTVMASGRGEQGEAVPTSGLVWVEPLPLPVGLPALRRMCSAAGASAAVRDAVGLAVPGGGCDAVSQAWEQAQSGAGWGSLLGGGQLLGLYVRPGRPGSLALTLQASPSASGGELGVAPAAVVLEPVQAAAGVGAVGPVQLPVVSGGPGGPATLHVHRTVCTADGTVATGDGLGCECRAGMVRPSSAAVVSDHTLHTVQWSASESRTVQWQVVRPAVVLGRQVRCVACPPGTASVLPTLQRSGDAGVCSRCADGSFAVPGGTLCHPCPSRSATCSDGKLVVAPGFALVRPLEELQAALQADAGSGNSTDSMARAVLDNIQACPNVFACQSGSSGSQAAVRRLGQDTGTASSRVTTCSASGLCSEGGGVSASSNSSDVGAPALSSWEGILDLIGAVQPSRCAPGHESLPGTAAMCTGCAHGWVHSPPVAGAAGSCRSCSTWEGSVLSMCLSLAVYGAVLLGTVYSWHVVATAVAEEAGGAGQGGETAKSAVGGKQVAVQAQVNPMYQSTARGAKGDTGTVLPDDKAARPGTPHAEGGDVQGPLLRASAGVLLGLHIMLSGLVADVLVDGPGGGVGQDSIVWQREVTGGVVPIPVHSASWACAAQAMLRDVSGDTVMASPAARQVLTYGLLPLVSVVLGAALGGGLGCALSTQWRCWSRPAGRGVGGVNGGAPLAWHAGVLAGVLSLPRSITGLVRIASVWDVAHGGSRLVSEWGIEAGSPEHWRLIGASVVLVVVWLGLAVAGLVALGQRLVQGDARASPGGATSPTCACTRQVPLPVPLPMSWSLLTSRRSSPLLPPWTPPALTPLLLPSVLWVWTIVAGVTNALVPVGAGATFSLAVAMIGMWLFHEVLRTFSVAEDLVNAKLRRAKRKARSSSHRPGMDSVRQASVDAVGRRVHTLLRLVGSDVGPPAQGGASVGGPQQAGFKSLRALQRLAWQGRTLHVLMSLVLGCVTAQAGCAYLLFTYDTAAYVENSRYAQSMEATFDVVQASRATTWVLACAFWAPIVVLVACLVLGRAAYSLSGLVGQGVGRASAALWRCVSKQCTAAPRGRRALSLGAGGGGLLQVGSQANPMLAGKERAASFSTATLGGGQGRVPADGVVAGTSRAAPDAGAEQDRDRGVSTSVTSFAARRARPSSLATRRILHGARGSRGTVAPGGRSVGSLLMLAASSHTPVQAVRPRRRTQRGDGGGGQSVRRQRPVSATRRGLHL